jgi:thiamine-phosphate pyrophosphorylase
MQAMASPVGDERRARLRDARLYLVCGAAGDGRRDLRAFLDAALRGGVDVVQLREKDPATSDEQILAAARVFRDACDAHGALFVLNDRPDLAAAAQADGVHVGQDDMPVADARALVGEDVLLGRSTHTPAQVDDAAIADVDYFAVGPVHATPTKPGRPAVGLELIRHAASAPRALPWFAIGGIDTSNVEAVVAAGATRIVVVRALTESSDPETTARALRGALPQEAPSAPRSRKRGRRERRSSEERNAELRAGLRPLAEDERPGAVTVGAIVAAILAVLVLVGYFTDARVADRGTLAGALLIAGTLLLAAWGMWNARYWAVLGFEALLAFLVLVASLALMVASNVWAVIQCVAVIGLGGWLFWKLIRAMARIQMPERRPAP